MRAAGAGAGEPTFARINTGHGADDRADGRAAEKAGTLVAPPIWSGYSPHHLREPERGVRRCLVGAVREDASLGWDLAELVTTWPESERAGLARDLSTVADKPLRDALAVLDHRAELGLADEVVLAPLLLLRRLRKPAPAEAAAPKQPERPATPARSYLEDADEEEVVAQPSRRAPQDRADERPPAPRRTSSSAWASVTMAAI